MDSGLISTTPHPFALVLRRMIFVVVAVGSVLALPYPFQDVSIWKVEKTLNNCATYYNCIIIPIYLAHTMHPLQTVYPLSNCKFLKDNGYPL